MKLLGNRFLIKKDKSEYNGKIILLENVDMHPFTGEIVLVGSQVKTKEYNVGDKVVFDCMLFDVTNIMEEYDNKSTYLFVDEQYILGKIFNKQS